MLKAIDSLQLANVNRGTDLKLPLSLGEGKDYYIHIGKRGDVSVEQNQDYLSTRGRIKNAVVDFFSILFKGKSASTTRATQIQSEVQRQLNDVSQMKAIVKQAFNKPVDTFKNEAQYLKPGTNIQTATFEDVTDSNKDRLGLGNMSASDREFALNNFPSFISGRDAIFGLLSTRSSEKSIALFASHSSDEALKAHSQESEAFNTKANAEFNRSFVQMSEQRAAAERQNASATSRRVDVADGKNVHFNPEIEVREF